MSFLSFNKLKSYSHDIAPIGFYFDIFSTESFQIPIMPIPMRIDKVTNADPTLFIIPDLEKLQKISEQLNLYINFEKFLYYGIKNLINYAGKKYKEINNSLLNKKTVIEWYQKSLLIKQNILGLKKDFTYLLVEFLRLSSQIFDKGLNKKNGGYRDKLIIYCEKVVNYFRDRIQENSIKIKNSEGQIEEKPIYKEKRGSYYPELIHFEVSNYEKKGKTKKKGFIPYLIYDDLAEVFFYNKQILVEENKEPFDLGMFTEKKILTQNFREMNYREEFPKIALLKKGI